MPVFLAASRRPAEHKFNFRSGLGRALSLFLVAALSTGGFAGPAAAAEPMDVRVAALVPELEATIASGMKAFDNPGLAIGIVTGDRLVYAKGFGVRKKGGEPVDAATVFQIGSATKSFLAATMAITADRKKFAWDDRVVDLDPDFQMKDLCRHVAPEGRFAAVAANLGPKPLGFVQFQVGQTGKLDLFRFVIEDGQEYLLQRE